jgi:hypothetical protein
MFPEAILPMRADKAALGYMPTSAFQYCEAMRVASSHGWYVFPPVDIQLRWNGADVLYMCEGSWEPLSFAYLPGFVEYWDENCPSGFQGLTPPYLRALPANGAVQVWSGWLIGSAAGWSTLVRPIVNVRRSNFFYCYEGVIETDEFQPCPLFINLQLTATDVVITLPRTDPLFQIQAIHRSSHDETAQVADVREGFQPADANVPFMEESDWQRFRQTIRTDRSDETHRLGDYGATVRKRRKGSGDTESG